MLYKDSTAIINKENLDQILGSKWVFRSNNGYVKTRPTPSDHHFYLFIWLL